MSAGSAMKQNETVEDGIEAKLALWDSCLEPTCRCRSFVFRSVIS